ncbi:hypothetical protein [Leuconostoc falkenbergense]|uniref:hypothetical protein n=1 Tax=Leuconostoc falkenbergense TaxID=2766470 RepID=UPI0039EBAB5D
MKFTEEQYQKILNINFNTFQIDLVGELIKYLSVDGTIWDDFLNKAIAIANPLTREWAHDKFVEKEKKYYWTTKKRNEQGKPMVLFNGAGGIVQMMGPKQPLTESEIKAWGYNPEMFDREKV